MSILKELKHNVKKKLRRYIETWKYPGAFMERLKSWMITISLGGLLLFLSKFLPTKPDIWDFLTSNSIGLLCFLGACFICCVWTYGNYVKTTNEYEAETASTEQAIKKNNTIWTIFWILWSIYCSIITLINEKVSGGVFITATILAIVPGFCAFLVSRRIMYLDLKQDEESRDEYGNKTPAHTLFTDKKYYSGYRGLICILLYFTLIGVGFLIKHLLLK